jgi:hypothetical protein
VVDLTRKRTATLNTLVVSQTSEGLAVVGVISKKLGVLGGRRAIRKLFARTYPQRLWPEVGFEEIAIDPLISSKPVSG